jgi:hypothetical protein
MDMNGFKYQFFCFFSKKEFAKFGLNKKDTTYKRERNTIQKDVHDMSSKDQADTMQLIKLGLFSLHPQNFILSYKVTQLLQKSQP